MIGALPQLLRRGVSPYTGIVGVVEECLAAPAEPRLFQASCSVGRSPFLLGEAPAHASGVGGTGRTRREAASAAVGEAIERYSATFVPDGLVAASARELGDDAVAPERFALFSARQYAGRGFPFRPFTDEQTVLWAEGRELPSGRQVFVPAELVYLGEATAGPGRPIAYATSNGLACAPDANVAIATALFELLERDAFMITWANRLSLPLVGPAAIDPGLREPFDRTGLSYAAVDLSAFHRLPTVLGVVRAPRGFPGALGVGAAAAATVERAWWKALAEAFTVRSAGAKLELVMAGRELGDHGERVESFDDHILYYADHEHAGATEFLDASPERTPAAAIAPLRARDQGDTIGQLCRRVEAAGATAYAVDVTSPDVADLGLSVVRVVAPELCALDAGRAARFLGGRRLYEAAQAAGLRPEVLREDDVNPDPHPFP